MGMGTGTEKETDRVYGGALASPPDSRDWRITRCMDMPSGSASIMETLPKEYHIEYRPAMKNQQQINSCTAFAMAGIFECIHHKLYGETKNFSIGYLYGNRRESTYKDEGCIMRDVPKTAQKYGDVYSGIYEDLSEVSEVINNFERAFDSVRDHAKKLVAGYVRLRDEDEAKAFLYKYKIPLFANTKMKYIHPLSKSTALHALMITGYTRNYFKCQNSWGQYKCPRPEIEYDNFEEIWGIIPMEEKKFIDVNSDRWSAEAIQTAANDGIIEGFPDGSFAPDEAVTREQMAVIWERMKRYMDENYRKADK